MDLKSVWKQISINKKLITGIILLATLFVFDDSVCQISDVKEVINSVKGFLRNISLKDSSRKGVIVGIPQSENKHETEVKISYNTQKGVNEVKVIWLTPYRQFFMSEIIDLLSLKMSYGEKVIDVMQKYSFSEYEGQLVLFHYPTREVEIDTFIIQNRSVKVDTIKIYSKIIKKPRWWYGLDKKKYWNLPFIGSFVLTIGSLYWYDMEKSNAEDHFGSIKSARNFEAYKEAVTNYENARTKRNIALNIAITSGIIFGITFIKELFRSETLVETDTHGALSTLKDETQICNNLKKHRLSRQIQFIPLVCYDKLGVEIQF